MHWQRSSGRPLNGDSSGGNCAGMRSNATRQSPKSVIRPSYSPKTWGSSSSLDVCICVPPGGCVCCDESKRDDPDRKREQARQREGQLRPGEADHGATEAQGAELGAVAGRVVGGERAPAQLVG